MIKGKAQVAMGVLAITSGVVLSGCVDHDYDLKKENIDLTITVGGNNLTLPGSSTDVYTLEQLLNLSSNSAIRPVTQDGEFGLSKGDYVLTRSGDINSDNVEVNVVNLSKLTGSTSTTPLSPFYNDGSTQKLVIETDEILNGLDISDDEVTKELVSLKSVTTDIPMTFEIDYISDDFSGAVTVEPGFLLNFDPSWTVVLEGSSKQFAEMVTPCQARFTKAMTFAKGRPLVLEINLTAVDLTKIPSGQGLYAPGHFRLDSDIRTLGKISVSSSEVAKGSAAHVTLLTHAAVKSAELLTATGVVDPKIDIKDVNVSITDIPSFLRDSDNNLDVANPQIYLTVDNMSPVEVTLNAVISAFTPDGKETSVGIGSQYGTDAIVLKPETTNVICLSRTGAGSDPNATAFVKVPDLGSLIASVPDRLTMSKIAVKSAMKECTIVMGRTYKVGGSYEVVVPLVFGPDMELFYTTVEDDWNEDLNKYSFHEALVTMNVYNTIPLNMEPKVVALDRQGNEITDITATVEGTVSAGTEASPSESTLTVKLKSTASNIGAMDGVKLVFHASSDGRHTDVPLNASQYMRFTDIKISILGGVDIDLN